MPEHADGYTFGLADDPYFVKSANCLSSASFSTLYIKVFISGIDITFNVHQIISIERHPKSRSLCTVKTSLQCFTGMHPQYLSLIPPETLKVMHVMGPDETFGSLG